MLKRTSSAQAGFTLVELLISVLITGGIGLAVFQMMTGTAKVAKNSEIAEELSQVSLDVLEYLDSPNHCNANFYNLPTGSGNLTSLKKCSQGNCRTTGSSINAYQVTTTSWNTTDTGISNKLRVVDINYNVNAATGTAITTLRLKVTLEKKDGNETNLRRLVETYSFPVVVQNSTVIGCPRIWNSTIPL